MTDNSTSQVVHVHKHCIMPNIFFLFSIFLYLTHKPLELLPTLPSKVVNRLFSSTVNENFALESNNNVRLCMIKGNLIKMPNERKCRSIFISFICIHRGFFNRASCGSDRVWFLTGHSLAAKEYEVHNKANEEGKILLLPLISSFLRDWTICATFHPCSRLKKTISRGHDCRSSRRAMTRLLTSMQVSSRPLDCYNHDRTTINTGQTTLFNDSVMMQNEIDVLVFSSFFHEIESLRNSPTMQRPSSRAPNLSLRQPYIKQLNWSLLTQ